MNKTFTTLLALVTIIAFTSGAIFAGAEIYLPDSAEMVCYFKKFYEYV